MVTGSCEKTDFSVWAPNRETTFAFRRRGNDDRIPAGFLLHVAKFKTQFLNSFQTQPFP